MSRLEEIEVLVRSRYPILYIVSWEEARVIDTLLDIGQGSNKKVFEWTCSGGLVPAGTPIQAVKMRNSSTKDPLVALGEVIEQVEPAIYVFKDFHPFLADNNFTVIRKLRDLAENLKSSYKTLILVSPFLRMPPDLEKDITVIDYALPNLEEMGILLDEVISEVEDNPNISINLSPQHREEILQAALGLTLAEAENVFAKALVSQGTLSQTSVTQIFAEKRQIIRKTGLLDYYEVDTNFEEIGGLASLKDWLRTRRLAFNDRAREFGLPVPRGVMIVGVQGCGKSMCAKAISCAWQLPLLRFDVGKMFSSLVGSSEENIRRALKIAESISPCVLWIDEMDKAFAGMSGSSTDSGTSQRVLGNLLTWLAEKSSSVFVAATANDIQCLPPELLRKGRFDEIFFVDLPNEEERKNILSIHLTKKRRDPSVFDLNHLASISDGLSGAELEEAIVSGLYDAFYQNRDIKTKDIVKNIKETVPLSKTMEEQILKMRKWCLPRTRNASILPEETASQAKRKLEFFQSKETARSSS